MSEAEEYSQQKPAKTGKQHNILPIWGNEQTMNLNPLILANIQGSSYFKVHLFKLKTYHEVVDEIYYQVKHLEPWERGSRKTSGQTGMCGGVRGVGAGGIVSTAFCLLYKLYTLRLTRKQVNGLLQHADSPYIRALGFMYVRYTQPPADLFDWYAEYLDDEEEIEPRAGGGGGGATTIGALVRQMLIKLDWFSTLFPRIPVPIQKQIEQKLAEHNRKTAVSKPAANYRGNGSGGGSYNPSRMEHDDRDKRDYSDGDRYPKDRPKRDDRQERDRDRDRERDRDRGSRDRERRDRDRDRRDRYRERSRSRDRRRRSRSRDRRYR